MIKSAKWMHLLEASQWVPSPGDAMVSVMGFKGTPASLSTMWPNDRVLRLFFDDLDKANITSAIRGFTLDQARDVVRWLDEVNQHADRLLAHCTGNNHRCAAIILFAVERYDIPHAVGPTGETLGSRMVYDRLWEAAGTTRGKVR